MKLINSARELLEIEETFKHYIKKPLKYREEDFALYMFEQYWGNTTGGLEGLGGSVITCQNTYVFIPRYESENCLVFFGDKFAYNIPYSEKFMMDVLDRNVAGAVSYKKKYFNK